MNEMTVVFNWEFYFIVVVILWYNILVYLTLIAAYDLNKGIYVYTCTYKNMQHVVRGRLLNKARKVKNKQKNKTPLIIVKDFGNTKPASL